MNEDDERLIRAIDAELRPEPMSPARRAAFRAALDERIAQRANPLRWLTPALATAAAAAVTLWLVRPVETEPVPLVVADTELYALIDSAADSEELTGTPSYLPDDFRAIALWIEPDETEP